MQQVYEKAEAIINTVLPHLVHLDNMLSAAACYGSQRFIRQTFVLLGIPALSCPGWPKLVIFFFFFFFQSRMLCLGFR